MKTELTIKEREGMPSLLRDGTHTIAVIKDEKYAPLLGSAGRLQEQLEIAVFILENVPGTSVDTSGMRRVLQDSGSLSRPFSVHGDD